MRKNSPLMAINAYEESVILLQYLVKKSLKCSRDRSNVSGLPFKWGDASQELIRCSISSEKNTYVKETNESSFSVRIRGKMRRRRGMQRAG